MGVLKWTRSNRCPQDARTCSSDTRGGDMGILQWEQCNGYPTTATRIMKPSALKAKVSDCNLSNRRPAYDY